MKKHKLTKKEKALIFLNEYFFGCGLFSMKLISYLILVLFISGCSTYKFVDLPFQKDDFDGYNAKPKMVETLLFEFELEDGAYIEKFKKRSVTNYDKHGRYISRYSFNPEGEQIYSSEALYGKDGRLLKTSSIFGTDTTKIVANYSYKKKQVDQTIHFGGIRSYFFDKRGNLIKDVIKKPRNGSTTLFFYNKHNRLLEFKTYDEENLLKSSYKYVYDSRGNNIKREQYDKNRVVKTFFVADFDDMNNQISGQNYRIKKNDTILIASWTEKHTYDDKDNIVSTIKYKKGVPQYFYKMKIEYY